MGLKMSGSHAHNRIAAAFSRSLMVYSFRNRRGKGPSRFSRRQRVKPSSRLQGSESCISVANGFSIFARKKRKKLKDFLRFAEVFRFFC